MFTTQPCKLLRNCFLFVFRGGGFSLIFSFALQDGRDSSRIDALYGSQIFDLPQLFQRLSRVEAIAALAASRCDQAHPFPVPQGRSTDPEHAGRFIDPKIDGGLCPSHGVIRALLSSARILMIKKVYRKPYNLAEI